MSSVAAREDYEIRVERFEASDLDALMEIEVASFSLPWSKRSYEELWPLDSIDIWVARQGSELVGYYLVQRVNDEAELHTFAVDPRLRRQGIGMRLMQHMLAGARADGVRNIYLQVRPSNEAACGLYEKLGFRPVGVRRRYYKDDGEDALVMRLGVR